MIMISLLNQLIVLILIIIYLITRMIIVKVKLVYYRQGTFFLHQAIYRYNDHGTHDRMMLTSLSSDSIQNRQSILNNYFASWVQVSNIYMESSKSAALLDLSILSLSYHQVLIVIHKSYFQELGYLSLILLLLFAVVTPH